MTGLPQHRKAGNLYVHFLNGDKREFYLKPIKVCFYTECTLNTLKFLKLQRFRRIATFFAFTVIFKLGGGEGA